MSMVVALLAESKSFRYSHRDIHTLDIHTWHGLADRDVLRHSAMVGVAAMVYCDAGSLARS
jgi:hypothetical protein